MELVQRNKQKFIPGFIAEMSREAYEGRGDVNEVVDIGRWVLRDGELYQLIDNEIATSTDNCRQGRNSSCFPCCLFLGPTTLRLILYCVKAFPRHPHTTARENDDEGEW